MNNNTTMYPNFDVAAPNAHINMSGLCNVQKYTSNGDVLYVIENPLSMIDGCFPCIIQLADTHKTEFYLVFGGNRIDYSSTSWRKCVKRNARTRVVYGPYPDYNTAALTYMLVHESAVKKIYEQLER